MITVKTSKCHLGREGEGEGGGFFVSLMYFALISVEKDKYNKYEGMFFISCSEYDGYSAFKWILLLAEIMSFLAKDLTEM